MPSKLIDLKTDLKAFKYGHDRPGGGDSDQPYIVTDFDGNTSVSVNPKSIFTSLQTEPFKISNFADRLNNGTKIGSFVLQALNTDAFIRGGAVGSAQAAVNDLFRVGALLTSKPRGPIFLAKQAALQFSNPKLETKRSIGGFFSDLLLGDIKLIQPTRLYNAGVNTLAQVPANALGIHFTRHGLFPVQDDSTKYLSIARSNNEDTKYDGAGLPKKSTNRLVRYATKLLPDPIPKKTRFENFVRIVGKLIPGVSSFLAPGSERIINSYLGGPGSTYGIGVTYIRRFDYTSNGVNKQPAQEKGVINYINTLGLSKDYFNPETSPSDFEDANNITNNGNSITLPPPAITYTYGSTVGKYLQLRTQLEDYQASSSIFNYNPYKNTNLGNQTGIFAINDNYNGDINSYNDTLPDIVYRNGLKEGLNQDIIVKIPGGWTLNNRETKVGSGRLDTINLTPLFSASSAANQGTIVTINSKPHSIQDFVNFRIQALDGDDPSNSTWMIFRAYITQFSDNTDSNWNEIKYAGRGEKFYIYDGFSRKIQIGFKVAALSAQEMEPMYQKLNFLMGNLMPDYKDGLLMRGPLVKMTVGNWLDGQDGILNSVSYTIPNDSPWEIGISADNPSFLTLPHVIEVSMTFTPIGSQTKGVNKVSQKSINVSHIAQNRTINGGNSQYIATADLPIGSFQ